MVGLLRHRDWLQSSSKLSKDGTRCTSSSDDWLFQDCSRESELSKLSVPFSGESRSRGFPGKDSRAQTLSPPGQRTIRCCRAVEGRPPGWSGGCNTPTTPPIACWCRVLDFSPGTRFLRQMPYATASSICSSMGGSSAPSRDGVLYSDEKSNGLPHPTAWLGLRHKEEQNTNTKENVTLGFHFYEAQGQEKLISEDKSQDSGFLLVWGCY